MESADERPPASGRRRVADTRHTVVFDLVCLDTYCSIDLDRGKSDSSQTEARDGGPNERQSEGQARHDGDCD